MADFFGKSLTMYKKIMDYQAERQSVISSNLANQNTPGYKARDIGFTGEFESRLKLARTQGGHIQSNAAQNLKHDEFIDAYERIGNDGNTVDLDREMMKMAQNGILYDASTSRVKSKFESLKNLISSIK